MRPSTLDAADLVDHPAFAAFDVPNIGSPS